MSLRDVERAMQVMVWFYNHVDTLGRLMKEVLTEERREEGLDDDEVDDDDEDDVSNNAFQHCKKSTTYTIKYPFTKCGLLTKREVKMGSLAKLLFCLLNKVQWHPAITKTPSQRTTYESPEANMWKQTPL